MVRGTRARAGGRAGGIRIVHSNEKRSHLLEKVRRQGTGALCRWKRMKAGLDRYAALHAQTDCETVDAATRIPRMLEAGRFGYFGISQYYRPIPELEKWLRRRVRMGYWKQWRWPRIRIRHPVELGVLLKAAIQHKASSLSYWRVARTPVIQQTIPTIG